MPFYLGIDAGGTKTDCAISNGAELLGQAASASCKASRVGEEEAARNLHEGIIKVCEAAKVSPHEIQQVCLGISGASLPGTVKWAQNVIHELVPGTVRVTGDHVIAHRAAFGILPGVLVIAGTGSVCYGRNDAGSTARAGGWGPAISDEGSAFWIGREAVSAALRSWDKGVSDGLLADITRCWNVQQPEEVVRIANSDARARFAELANPVAAAAERGDNDAQTVVGRAGRELAGLAGAVITRLWPDGGTVRVAMAGGVLQGSLLVRNSFQNQLHLEYPHAVVSFAYVRPVLGALELAAERGVLQ
jgi:N-acetylglucosamine kinase-like BadF-type ATPase